MTAALAKNALFSIGSQRCESLLVMDARKNTMHSGAAKQVIAQISRNALRAKLQA